jgi:hypothetical protein
MSESAIGWLRHLAIAAAAVMAAGCGNADGIDLHPPSNQTERAAARVALDFAALLQGRDIHAACGLTRGAAARTLRCSHNPRMPAWLRIPARQDLEVVDVPPARVPRAIRLGIPVPATLPVLAVEVDSSGHVVYVEAYGYA